MAKLNKANKPTFQGFQEISALKMVDKSSTIRALDTDLGVFLEDCSVIEVTVDPGLDNGA